MSIAVLEAGASAVCPLIRMGMSCWMEGLVGRIMFVVWLVVDSWCGAEIPDLKRSRSLRWHTADAAEG